MKRKQKQSNSIDNKTLKTIAALRHGAVFVLTDFLSLGSRQIEGDMTFNLVANAPILEAFSNLPDPRKSRNQIYSLIDIVGVAIIAILCSANN